MNKKRKKRPLTLLEIMIVIFLIGIIGSVIGYNMKGSLDKGKAFKSEQAASRIREILLLEVAKGANIEEVVGEPQKYLEFSGLVEKPEKMLKDGWGGSFDIKIEKNGTDIKVVSDALRKYQQAQNKKLGKVADDEDKEENS